MIRSAAELKSFFQTGDKPSESQWGDFIDTVFFAVDGISGISSQGGLHLIKQFTTPAEIWSWQHNLGFKPVVQVYNLNGDLMLSCVHHIDDNNLEVQHTFNAAGFVILN